MAAKSDFIYNRSISIKDNNFLYLGDKKICSLLDTPITTIIYYINREELEATDAERFNLFKEASNFISKTFRMVATQEFL